MDRDLGTNLGSMQNFCKVESVSLPVIDSLFDVELVNLADHFLHRAKAELSHVFARFLCNELEKILDKFWFPGEFFT